MGASAYYDSIKPYIHRPAFRSLPEKSHIYVSDPCSMSATKAPYVFDHSHDFERHISSSPQPSTRIVSIFSPNSPKPLGITEHAFLRLMDQYGIGQEFLDLAVNFGEKPHSADSGNGSMTISHRGDGSYDMQYLFAFPEHYRTANGDPSWTFRQLAVFHRYHPSGVGNLWVFLHANPHSKAQRCIEDIVNLRTNSNTQEDWADLHLSVLSIYLGNWRWYLRHLGTEVEKPVSYALTLDLSRNDGAKDGHTRAITLQHLDDQLLSVPPRLNVALATIKSLEQLYQSLHARGLFSDASYQRWADRMSYQRTQIEGYLKSFLMLETKVQRILNLLSIALGLKNQDTTVEINNKMLRLTNEAFEDNATVRVVTLVTLIYLPASFISTVLGMNLFNFDDATGNFVISGQFWIFVVLAVPLTLLTLGTWYVFTRRRRKQQRKRMLEEENEELDEKESLGEYAV